MKVDLRDLERRHDELVAEARSIHEAAEAEERNLSDDESKRFQDAMAEANATRQRIEREKVLRRYDEAPPVPGEESGSVNGEYRSFGEFLQRVRFEPGTVNTEMREAGDMSMGIGPAGGYLVPDQFRPEILQFRAQRSIIRPRATVIPAGDYPDAKITQPAVDYSEGVFGGAAVSWIEEAAEKPQTDIKLDEVALEPHEVAAHIVVTDKLLRNAPAAEVLIRTKLLEAMVAAEDFAFLRGDGAGKPQGIIGSPATKTIPRASTDEVSVEDLLLVMGSALAFSTNLVWIISNNAFPAIAGLTDGADRLLYNAGDVARGIPPTLWGYPVVWSTRSPALGGDGDVLLADLNAYLIKDGSGPFVAMSDAPHFTSNKTVVKAFWNVDGTPWLKVPIELENGTTVSPFVALAEPTGG